MKQLQDQVAAAHKRREAARDQEHVLYECYVCRHLRPYEEFARKDYQALTRRYQRQGGGRVTEVWAVPNRQQALDKGERGRCRDCHAKASWW